MINLTEVRKSKIEGTGLFASAPIKSGTNIGAVKHIPAKKRSKFTLDFDDGTVVRFVNNFRYLNHSSRPNVRLNNKLEVIAIRNIKKGEELTMYYGEEFEIYVNG